MAKKQARARKVASIPPKNEEEAEGIPMPEDTDMPMNMPQKTSNNTQQNPLMPSEDDILLAMAMKDANFARILLASELGARKAIKEFLMMMASKGSDDPPRSSLDDLIKMYLLKKWEKEEKMNEILLPIILKTVMDINIQNQIQQCVQQRMMMYMMKGMDYFVAMQKANEECQQLAQQSNALMPLLGLLGNLGSSGLLNMSSQSTGVSTDVSEPSASGNSEQEPSEEELSAV